MRADRGGDGVRRTRVLATLLAFVTALQFGYPVTEYGELWMAGYMMLYAVMLGFGILCVHGEGETVAPMIVVTGVFLVAGTWFALAQDSSAATVTMLISVSASMAALVFALMRFIFGRGHRATGVELVMAAITAYLIMGGFFAATFTLLEIAQPGSFVDPQAAGPLSWQQLLYYAYVSISTLGYGDILPVSPWARSYGSLVAVLGTLYLTVVVARLVSIWSSNRAAADE